jgi:two-component system, OmpR family, alkaline phosphatase synthesis response regulator PhoP
MGKQKILVVEDEADILQLVSYNLTREGFEVAGVSTGEEGLDEARKGCYDLLLLDLMLPGTNGLDVCRTLRREDATAGLPIIMLTARGEDIDIVTGLELGADDYVTKPFSPRVLTARIRAVLRRDKPSPEAADKPLAVHDITIDPRRFHVEVAGQTVDLTATEFGVLHYLAGRPGWVFTRTQIIEAVKGDDYPVTDRSVDVQIVGLRRKLGRAGDHIETVRGIGYRFKE